MNPDIALHGQELLLKQGAEALVYRSWFLPGLLALRKHRPSKPYRHPLLDQRLTKHRTLVEARLLQRCRKNGIDTPSLYFLDERKGNIWMEFIQGRSVHDILTSNEQYSETAQSDTHQHIEFIDMMRRIGRSIAQLHECDIIHGDLTTSNLLRREREHDGVQDQSSDGSIVIIDLGLGSVSSADEDKAVDLNVLERAFISTHPKSSKLFEEVLQSYAAFGGAKALSILKRLESVRLRGRKRTMVG